jgi:poly(A) polymerase Pap1
VKQNTLIATAFVPIIKLELNFEGLSEDLKIAPLKIGKITSIKIDIVLNSQDGNEAH